VKAREVLHYRITGELGQGAMGEVYRAVDQRLGREVALKMLPGDIAEDEASQKRLLREAQAASALNHPGIVTLYDLASADGRTFLVMELVTGERFSDLARRGTTWRRAIELVAGVASALAAAHARGILHRDIKSDNLMVTPSGQPKVLDFGVAKLRVLGGPASLRAPPSVGPPSSRGAPLSELTRAGQVIGTTAYLAPECFDGKADARSEVFSLGVVLYELLTGKRPFDRNTSLETVTAIHMDDMPPLATAIPPAVDAVVRKALAKQPEDRFADMASFEAALRGALIEPRRRVPWPAVGAGAAAAIAVPLAWFLLAPSRGETVAAVDAGADGPPAIEVTASRRLTLDPGCEEYPHMHPDGRRVIYDGVFDGDYDLAVLDLESGEKRRLTSSHGWDYASAVAPDGKRVAYIHEDLAGRTLRVLELDERGAVPRDLGAVVGYPSWTADGALLVGDAAGRVVRRELEGGETALGQLPAGARLYHLVEVAGSGIALLWWTSSEADATALGELDKDGTLRVLEESTTDYEGGLAAARTGGGYYATRKSVAERNQLLFRSFGVSRALVVPGGLSPSAGIDIARDGKRLVFSTCVERLHLARIRADGTTADVSRGDWQDSNPRVLDARRLIVTSDRVGKQYGWLLDLDGGEPRKVTPPDAVGASPSPDGVSIVYVASGGRGGLSIVPMDGGEPRALTNDPTDSAPTFTRDAREVIFERTAVSGETSVMVISAAGGDAKRLAIGANPTPSPVDDSVAFVTAADASGARQVMLTDLAGAAPRPLPGLERAGWLRPRFSLDGKRLLLVRGFQQLVSVTVDGSAEPRVVWTATTGSVSAAEWARNDDSVIAVLGTYDGDLWLAEGSFP
jgi:eukaryotic-like serine/threonine-protein kinase